MREGSHRPLISVGVLSYKRPHLLQYALDSVARQTYPNLEVLISDNGSHSPEIRSVVAEFSENRQGVRVFFHEQNRGAFWNFRFILEQASGELFIWLADDDFWSPDFLETIFLARADGRPCLVYSASVSFCLETQQAGTPVKERPSKHRGLLNVLRQVYFDSDSVIYGLFDAAIGKKYAALLSAWPAPGWMLRRFPTLGVDFVSYAFLYGLLLDVDFINASEKGGTHLGITSGGTHSMVNSTKGSNRRGWTGAVGGLLAVFSVIFTMAYIHILLTGRFIKAGFFAHRVDGILFAPVAAGYLFLRRLAKAVLARITPLNGVSE